MTIENSPEPAVRGRAPRRFSRSILVVAALGAIAVVVIVLLWQRPDATKPSAGTKAPRPALTVSAAAPQIVEWPRIVVANGNITAWQEAVVGTEIGGLRLTEVLVNVGDQVKQGQLLARMGTDSVEADLAQANAATEEANAALLNASANAERARRLQPSGAISVQEASRNLTDEQTARARLAAARARVKVEQIRLAQARVVAPDAGVISGRSATVGGVVQPGQELFRLIRGNRLEWRAEVTAADLARVSPGLPVQVQPANGGRLTGNVRVLAPSIDPNTRIGLVYVDLPPNSEARAGMFARGEFELARASALTVPQSALLLREGFSYVYRIGGDQKVVLTKVETGRRVGDRVEIVAGLEAGARLVAGGVSFLADGDTVRVVDTPAAVSR